MFLATDKNFSENYLNAAKFFQKEYANFGEELTWEKAPERLLYDWVISPPPYHPIRLHPIIREDRRQNCFHQQGMIS